MENEETFVEEQEQTIEVPEMPIEVSQGNDMSNGFDMDFALGNLAPKNNSDGFDMGLDLGLDF